MDALEVAGDHSTALRIEFQRVGDRYQHQVWSVAAGRRELLLSSVEGNDQQHWPASPPLQQLAIEQRAGLRPVALAVGMAGSAHWSASFAVHPEQQGVLCELACRWQSPPPQLTSTYRLHTETAWDQQRLLLAAGCEIEPLEGLQLGTEADLLTLSIAASTTTTSWCYWLRLQK